MFSILRRPFTPSLLHSSSIPSSFCSTSASSTSTSASSTPTPTSASTRTIIRPNDEDCCGSGCENCVWVEYFSDKLSHYAQSPEVRRRKGKGKGKGEQILKKDLSFLLSPFPPPSHQLAQARKQIKEDLEELDPAHRAFVEFEMKMRDLEHLLHP